MRRVGAGLSICIAVGLSAVVSTAAARSGPAIKGEWCHVDHWLCAAMNPASRSASPEQECAHEVLGRAGRLRRLTYIYFRETDHDHA